MMKRSEKPIEGLEAVNAKTRSAYNLAAERYHELFHDELDQKAHDRAALDSFARRFDEASLLLDAGCGPCGHIGRYLFNKGLSVVGVDISDRCVELAQEHNPELRFERADLAALPFEDHRFNGILSYYSIIDTPKRFLGTVFREFHRVLVPGGSLLVVVKAGTTEGFDEKLLGISTEIYVSTFTADELSGFMKENGFTLESVESRTPYEFEIDAERIYAIGRKRDTRI